ncbi:MAG: hypothetical protein J5699_05670 [Bacteroidales bacterium]|nr:hypothetical protein [Bacteroidales bacterium]
MKRYLLLLICFAGLGLAAEGRVAERTYLTTDRDVYVAGDRVWCSAFCMDAATGRYSGVSAVLYLELHSAEGMVQTAKIALRDGRGAGCFTLLAGLPTGNYRIVAYTAQNRNETGYDYEGLASRTISVFNVLSKSRVKGGVKVVVADEYGAAETASPQAGEGISVFFSREDGLLRVASTRDDRARLSVSVYHEDGIRHPGNVSAPGFASRLKGAGSVSFVPGFVPEYEGELIKGRIAGASPEVLAGLKGKYAFISAPGDGFDIYCSPIGADGSVSFRTGNIYGDRDLVCEIEGLDSTAACHLEFEDPFVGAKVSDPAPLLLSECLAPALEKRGTAMQIERRFMSDTLMSWFRVRHNTFLGSERTSFILDDYTRFPLMKEVFTEFIHQIKVSGNARRGRTISIALEDTYGRSIPSTNPTLVLLDGVPVFNHDKIYDYDPLLVKRIDLYPYPHLVGTRFFDGVINFVTYKGNMPSYTFDGNVRIVNFNGVSFPQAYTCSSVGPDSGYPDYRQTIYWDPLVEISAGGSYEAQVKLPDYKGEFTVVVEGFCSDGTPVYQKNTFCID